VDEICDKSHDAGLKVHLDGARLFNAATFLKQDVAVMTRKFDSVQFCLSKGLGAPVGSMIAGSREFIERCRSIRKMLGGGMRQAGVLAAAGLVALEKGPLRLQEDHDNAHFLARQLAEIPGIGIDPAKVQTNIVIYSVKPAGMLSADFLSALASRNVLAVPVDEHRVRMVTHLDVNRSDIENAVAAVREVMRAA
jgi:threonine aldolase